MTPSSQLIKSITLVLTWSVNGILNDLRLESIMKLYSFYTLQFNLDSNSTSLVSGFIRIYLVLFYSVN